MGETVLIIDDDDELGRLVCRTLSVADYVCLQETNPLRGLAVIEEKMPNVILLDVEMPEMNGLDLCRRIKEDPLLSRIPVLMLTGRGSVEDRVEGLDAGADDYLPKPFDLRELQARVDALIRISRREGGRNPTSGLPGAETIDRWIEEALEREQKEGVPFVLMHLDIDNFKAFSDCYGFHQADEVIRATAQVMLQAAREVHSEARVGHLGGDDFIILCGVPYAKTLGPIILSRFDEAMKRHFKPDVLERGYFCGRGRDGRFKRFPITSLSIAAVSSEGRGFPSLEAASQALVPVKRAAKARRGSFFIFKERPDRSDPS